MNKELYSTKGLYTSKKLLLPLLLYIVAEICYFTLYPNALKSVLGYVISLIVLLVMIVPFGKALQMKKSYVIVYDDRVVGCCVPKKILTEGHTNFTLLYQDITHVIQQTNVVEIFFNGGSYVVQAYGVEGHVAALIRKNKEQYLQSKENQWYHK